MFDAVCIQRDTSQSVQTYLCKMMVHAALYGQELNFMYKSL